MKNQEFVIVIPEWLRREINRLLKRQKDVTKS